MEKVNIALIQIQPPSQGMRIEAVCEHMREMVLQAVDEGKRNGAPVHMAVLPVSLVFVLSVALSLSKWGELLFRRIWGSSLSLGHDQAYKF